MVALRHPDDKVRSPVIGNRAALELINIPLGTLAHQANEPLSPDEADVACQFKDVSGLQSLIDTVNDRSVVGFLRVEPTGLEDLLVSEVGVAQILYNSCHYGLLNHSKIGTFTNPLCQRCGLWPLLCSSKHVSGGTLKWIPSMS